MTDEAAGRPGLKLDTTVSHSARIWNYWLGGKDNISQVVLAVPHSGHTRVVQARKAYYSKTVSFAVRVLPSPSLGIYVRFVGRVFLTLA
ncbi:MAG TPA: SAM-dependent methyltransferase [Streptosporangiaceae bacterium]|nr:SAM-dependent methyltransferase [Streptosporangiaceae bacterium]